MSSFIISPFSVAKAPNRNVEHDKAKKDEIKISHDENNEKLLTRIDSTVVNMPEGEEILSEEEFRKCLAPMLFCLKLSGAYFSRSKQNGDLNWLSNYPGMKYLYKVIGSRGYSRFILLFLYLDVIRYLTVFAGESERYRSGIQIVFKLVTLAIIVLCTILRSSYYVACSTGTFDEFLCRVRMTQ